MYYRASYLIWETILFVKTKSRMNEHSHTEFLVDYNAVRVAFHFSSQSTLEILNDGKVHRFFEKKETSLNFKL